MFEQQLMIGKWRWVWCYDGIEQGFMEAFCADDSLRKRSVNFVGKRRIDRVVL